MLYPSIELRFIQTDADDHIINIKKMREKIVWDYHDPSITSHHLMYYDTVYDVIETFINLMDSLKYDVNPYTHIQVTIPAFPPVVYAIEDNMPGIHSISFLIQKTLKHRPVSLTKDEVNEVIQSNIVFEDDEDEDEDEKDEEEEEDEDEEEEEDEDEDEKDEEEEEEEEDEDEEETLEEEKENLEEEETPEQNYVDDIMPLSWNRTNTEETDDEMPPLVIPADDEMPPLIYEADDEMPPLIEISKSSSSDQPSISYFS